MYLKISHTIQQNHQLQIINAFIHCLADNLFPWKKFLNFKKLLSIMQAIVQSARKTQRSLLPNFRLPNYNKSKPFFILEREMYKWDKTLISHIFFNARAAVVTNFQFKWSSPLFGGEDLVIEDILFYGKVSVKVTCNHFLDTIIHKIVR